MHWTLLRRHEKLSIFYNFFDFLDTKMAESCAVENSSVMEDNDLFILQSMATQGARTSVAMVLT